MKTTQGWENLKTRDTGLGAGILDRVGAVGYNCISVGVPSIFVEGQVLNVFDKETLDRKRDVVVKCVGKNALLLDSTDGINKGDYLVVNLTQATQ